MFIDIDRQVHTFDFTETKKVFDIKLYLNTPEEKRVRVIANDLAGLVLEGGDRKLEERINPWYVAITPDGKAINLVSREEVTKNFGDKTRLARDETQGTLDFYYEKTRNAKEGDLIFWISPSGGNSPYVESRINVAKIRSLYGLKVLECYGIPSKLNPDEILSLANYFQIMSEVVLSETPEDLRKTSILWPGIKNEDVWKLLQGSAPLDSDAWEEVAKGTPRKIKREAYKAALPVAKQMAEDLKFAKKEIDFVKIGAWGERLMYQQGWRINKYQCPGSLNSDILTSNFIIDAIGNFRMVDYGETKKGEKWDYHKGECIDPECKHKGTEVWIGPCDICEDCEKKYDAQLAVA